MPTAAPAEGRFEKEKNQVIEPLLAQGSLNATKCS